ncbi:ABC transporter substrate-binding protein [Luteibaculum oceani]|uniref:ABC transporter substrate-binding protein n=1 Tax=Luteibaculum oceani TaxID=1294296 RepID=A0A5C6V937_9FLAO|nr:helical backbone metal receptor [Luteibaculum oceani]TXC81617.1 ABC transporter substrate-binding protein [Luteibaculum oceani]
MRIVSLVPSLTEYLFDLGLDAEVIGITKFCIHPEKWFRTKERVGGTKTANLDKILKLKPDLIVANKEENTKEDILFLQEHFEVILTDINNQEDLIPELKKLAIAVNKEEAAKKVVAEITASLNEISPLAEPKKTVYLIWNDPIMAVGKQTFIHSMLELVNLRNGVHEVVSDPRYPSLTSSDLQKINPELLILSSEPYPFKEKHLLHFRKLLPTTQVVIADGEMFSWYGSRLKYFNAHWRALKSTL